MPKTPAPAPAARNPESTTAPATSRLVRSLAVATLAANIGIVVTGGAVRLTASGLGCPEWPLCTADSLVTTPEMGVHGIIEFGNRLLTFVLAAIAFAMVASVWKSRSARPDLFWLSVAALAGIPAQALIGGVTVWTDLNPWVVGLHFIVSMAIIGVAVALVNRAWLSSDQLGSGHAPLAGATLRPVVWAIAVLSAVTVVLGVIVTGSGPHAGDHGAARNNLDPDLMTRFHVVPVYLLVFTTAVALYLVYRRAADPRLKRALIIFTAVLLAQAVIGYTQHFLHLPIALVALHMLGASMMTAAAANVVYTGLSRKVPGGSGASLPAASASAQG